MARDRAGLSQAQVAARTGKPRSTIARWESGARTPSLESVKELVAACGLELVVGLAEADKSLAESIRDQLALEPKERLRHLLAAAEADALIRSLALVAGLATPVIVVGSLAAALWGAAQRPRGGVEVLASDRGALLSELEGKGAQASDDEERFNEVNRRWRWSLGNTELSVVDRLAGASDYGDLRKSAVGLAIEDYRLKVAHPRDLLRLAEASPLEEDRAYAPGLRALLELTE